MSEFKEISRAAYEAVIEDDLDTFLGHADPEVEFNSLIENRTYHGHEGVTEWWNNVLRSLGGVNLELEEVVDFDDHGYVKMAVGANESDVDLPQAIWQATRIENGKVVWWGIFATEKEARKALGVGKRKS